jgi:hypothetical protein
LENDSPLAGWNLDAWIAEERRWMVGLSLAGNEGTERHLDELGGVVNGLKAKRQELEGLYEVEADE